MSVKHERYRALNSLPQGAGPVVYWMNRDGRIRDNWAYERARERALEAGVPLLVLYNLAPGFLCGGYRQHAFKVGGLREVEAHCWEAGTPFFLVSGEDTPGDILAFLERVDTGALVTDFFPLRLPRAWIEGVRAGVRCAMEGVDAHNVVPCWVASDKREFAARTLRPKLHRLLPEYLEEFPEPAVHPHAYGGAVPAIDWDAILDDPSVDRSVPAVDWAVPGYAAGMDRLRAFVDEKIHRYKDDRNDANKDGQSNLSPWLHYGQIAPQRAALEAVRAFAQEHGIEGVGPGDLVPRLVAEGTNGSGKYGGAYEAFLEELVVRRELSDNFCFHTPDYDRVTGFPEWARHALDRHREDPREHIYTEAELDASQTHDDLWNASQRQLKDRGKLHGYLRMYWGKKILEWTPSPEEALRIAIALNDRYELDGRDPNGYTGIAWCLGGVHDRPWFERPVFGNIRYMALSGAKKHFDVAKYVARWSPTLPL